MPVVSRLVSMVLRFAELVCACVVAGIIGSYLDHYGDANAWPERRFIYTETIAGLSILLSLVWLLPFAGGFLHWPMDIVISAAWFAAFGLLVNALGRNGCGGGAFSWGGITQGGVCNRWRVSSLLRCVIRNGRELFEGPTSTRTCFPTPSSGQSPLTT
jgi:hypothetical protein